MKIKFVVDSSVQLLDNDQEIYGVEVVPLTVSFGAKQYLDEIDISLERFKQKQKQQRAHLLPPLPGQFMQKYRTLLAETDVIISLHSSAHIFNAFQSACAAKEMMNMTAKHNIVVIDSGSAGPGAGLVLRKMLEQAGGLKDPQSFSKNKPEVHNLFLSKKVPEHCRLALWRQLTTWISFIFSELDAGSVFMKRQIYTTTMPQVCLSRHVNIYLGHQGTHIEKMIIAYQKNTQEPARLLKEKFLKAYKKTAIQTLEMNPFLSAYLGLNSLALFFI